MAQLENAELGVRFSIADQIDVRAQLRYFGQLTGIDADLWLETLWQAALPLIQGWECAAFPNPNEDLGKVFDPQVGRIVTWAASQVMTFMRGLGTPPKGS